jgi:myosin heavy subunit
MGISIFSLIDEKTALGAAKDEDIVSELKKVKHKNIYVDAEPNKTTFMILHTQNPVVYSVEGFRLKNQDSVTA